MIVNLSVKVPGLKFVLYPVLNEDFCVDFFGKFSYLFICGRLFLVQACVIFNHAGRIRG